MCPWAYQTSLWIREVRRLTGLEINWRFFSLEEVNRPEGKPHPWERPLAYGWSPLRVAARLRRRDMALCDAWYAACGKALHTDGRKPHNPDIAKELLESIGASADDWDLALADDSTHDDVKADHFYVINELAGFGVPIVLFPPEGSRSEKAVFWTCRGSCTHGRSSPRAVGPHSCLHPRRWAIRNQDPQDPSRFRVHR